MQEFQIKMLLVNYSSSSDSDEGKSKDEIKKGNSVAKNLKNRILLPQASLLLGKRKIQTIDDEVIDDPSEHDGRIRSFKHERGNWATYVYIPVNKSLLEDLQDICHVHLKDNLNFKKSNEMHISLTKTVVLQYHFIDSFVETLQTATQALKNLTVSLNKLKVYTNAERTRTFLALKVDDLYIEKMLKILNIIDTVMKDFKLPPFYKDPSFHISILWCSGDCVDLVESLVPTILDSLQERLPLSLKIDEIYCKSGFKEFCFNLNNN